MASATQPKRMVSSVFITLAPPCRATLTQRQHALQTHKAPARDQQHAAVRVEPGDGAHGVAQRRRRESSSSGAEGGTDSPSKTHPGAPARGPDPSGSTDIARRGPGEPQGDRRPDGLIGNLPPPPMHPAYLEAKLSEDATSPVPPSPPQGSISLPLSGQPLIPDKQQQRTPSSGESQGEQFHGTPARQQDMNPESREVCGFCRKAVALAEPAIEALNRTYHDSCFQCRQCQTPLAGKLYYNKAGIPLCEDCYQASLELCWACGEAIKDLVIRALERTYHPPCFTCATCDQQIGEQRFAQGEVGEVYCIQDYYRKYAPQCCACKQLIIPKEDGTDSYTVECLGNSFHEDCYRCEICAIQLSPEPNERGCYPLDGRVLCKSCHLSLLSAQP